MGSESKYEVPLHKTSDISPPPLREVLVVAENLPEITQQRLSELCENIPEDWQSSSSLNSELQKLENNILSLAEQVETQSHYSVEPHPPSKVVACIFASIYTFLGLVIVTTIILTVLYNFSMILLISIVVIIFITLVVVTNFCVIVYQY